MADLASLDWGQVAAGITAIGTFGTAAFGLTESFGKAFAFGTWGLPYAGFGTVKKMLSPLLPALQCAYGDSFETILAQQYSNGGSTGAAPDTVRQAVRLALPFLSLADAAALIKSVWGMADDQATSLAACLQAGNAAPALPPGGNIDQMQALAGRFATALDARINAAFAMADQRYETWARTVSGFVALALAIAFNETIGPAGAALGGHYPWPAVIAAGLIAVPLAPVANDVSNYLQNALNSFKTLAGKT
jgi:hypothetical protein